MFELAASRRGGTVEPVAVFAHCGVLSVGIRKKLGCRARSRCASAIRSICTALALKYPAVPIIIPHFGAGMLREALMLADCCPNVHLDTSSSNSWIKYTPGLTLEQVFKTALDVVGPDRLLFGTDSSFFPRGWNGEIYQQQKIRARRHRRRARMYSRRSSATISRGYSHRSRGPALSYFDGASASAITRRDRSS